MRLLWSRARRAGLHWRETRSESMKRVLFSMTVLLLALVAAQNLAAQKKGAGILSGVVLGPDDRPVSHASVSYQSSAGLAPHPVHTHSHGRFTITKFRSHNYHLRS